MMNHWKPYENIIKKIKMSLIVTGSAQQHRAQVI
jgi:hypothetical protein